MADRDGIVKETRNKNVLNQAAKLVALELDVRPGKRVRAFQVGPDRVGAVFTEAPTAAQAKALCRQAATEIQIEIAATE